MMTFRALALAALLLVPSMALAQGASRNTAQFVAPPKENSVRLLRPGDAIDTETSKADAADSWLWRVACYEIQVPQTGGVRVDLESFGQRALLQITPSCQPRMGAFEEVDNDRSYGDLSVVTEITGPRRFVQAWFRGSGKRYRVRLTQMTPQETAAWKEERRLAEMRRAAERREAFGQLLTTGVAMAGVAASGGDLNNVDLSGNPLQVLQSAGSEVARQNSISQARLEATIAAAQSSGSERASSQQGTITVASTPPSGASSSVPAPAAKPAQRTPPQVLYFCIASTKKTMPDGSDGIDKMYYGIVTATGHNIEGAERLFFSQVGGNRGRIDTESGGGCSPNSTRAEASSTRDTYMRRDQGLPQVTLDLVLPGVGTDLGDNF